MRAWSLVGLTASANTGTCPIPANGVSATHVDGGRFAAIVTIDVTVKTTNAANVATRRIEKSDKDLAGILEAAFGSARPGADRAQGSIEYNPFVLARAVGWLDKVAFSPDTLPDDLVIGLALTPTVIAGLIFFKLAALEMLVVALFFGAAAQLVCGFLFRKYVPKPEASPVIAAVIGVALVGPGASLLI